MHSLKVRSVKLILTMLALATTTLLSFTVQAQEGVKVLYLTSQETQVVKVGDDLSGITDENNKKIEYILKTALDLPFYGYAVEIASRLGIKVEAPAENTSVTTEFVASQPVSHHHVAPVFTGVLSNGNTAGEIGSYAATQMAAATGVPASTWEYIIARESNGQVDAQNASGASGLFQTMPGWGATGTVEEQIQSALNAYNSQGMSAWGY